MLHQNPTTFDVLSAATREITAEHDARFQAAALKANAAHVERTGRGLLMRSIDRDSAGLSEEQKLALILHLADEWSAFDGHDKLCAAIEHVAQEIADDRGHEADDAGTRLLNRGQADLDAALAVGRFTAPVATSHGTLFVEAGL